MDPEYLGTELLVVTVHKRLEIVQLSDKKSGMNAEPVESHQHRVIRVEMLAAIFLPISHYSS